MDRKIIEFKTDGQQLQMLTPFNRYASNTVQYIEARFLNIETDASWTGYDRVRAVWYTDKITKVSDIENGATITPAEVLTLPGVLQMNLCATIVRDGVLVARMTSYPVSVLGLDKTNV